MMNRMTQFASILLLLLAGCGGAVGEVPDNHVLSHDMGAIFLDPNDPASWEVRHDFVFRNPSAKHTAKLEIQGQTCRCGERIVHVRDVPPGEEAIITLAYPLRLENEKRRESVLLATGLREMPHIVVSLAAEGFPRLAISPDPVPNLRVRPGRTTTFEVTARAYRSEAELATALQPSVEGAGLSLVSVRREETVVVAEGVVRDVASLVVAMSLADGNKLVQTDQAGAGILEVRHGNHRLRRGVRWSVYHVIRAVPNRLVLRSSPRSAEPTVIRLTAEEPFTLSGVYAEDPAFDCSQLTEGSRTEHLIAVDVVSMPDGAQTTTSVLRVETDHPEQQFLEIPVILLDYQYPWSPLGEPEDDLT